MGIFRKPTSTAFIDDACSQCIGCGEDRFKGLGEISPKEFAQFIGKEMVLAHGHCVEYAPRAESDPILTFSMGKNTPERKAYIMDKLVVPVQG